MLPSPLQLCVQKLRILIEDSDQNRESLLTPHALRSAPETAAVPGFSAS